MSYTLGEGKILVRVSRNQGGERTYEIEETEGESCEFMEEGLEIESFLEHLEFPGCGLYEVTGIEVTVYPGSLWEDPDHDVHGGVVTAVLDPEEGGRPDAAS